MLGANLSSDSGPEFPELLSLCSYLYGDGMVGTSTSAVSSATDSACDASTPEKASSSLSPRPFYNKK